MSDQKQLFIQSALDVLELEASAIQTLASRLNDKFVTACEWVLACSGRIIVMGIGKSGHVGRKVAATLASTGTPAFFVHAAEAMHGDLGMITADDVVVLISKSGETEEIIAFVPLLRRLGCKLIGMTGKVDSTIAGLVDVNLDITVEREACGLGLAPTTSTTVTMALGDALAVSVLRARGFSEDDFARSHPGGMLGRKLLVKVSDIMHAGNDLPKIKGDTNLAEAIIEISNKRLGMTTVVDNTGVIIGVCTDGDLRRAFSGNIDVHTVQVAEVMTRDFRVIYSDMLATEALHIMEEYKITSLPVLNRQQRLVGALNVHDLFRARVV